MKNSYLYILSLVLLITFSNTAKAQTTSSCDSKALKDELYQLLKPDYRYDKSRISEITIKDVLQAGELGVPLLQTEKYRIMFNTRGYSTGLDIKIYNKPAGTPDRIMLYSIKEERDAGKTIFYYKPGDITKSTMIYIDYIVPAATEEAQIGTQGCVVFLMGYKIG